MSITASPVPHTNRARAPLAELPLHQFVSQSLAGSPTTHCDNLLKTPSRSRSRSPSLPRSRRGSLSVSPHKQAVLQNHRLGREGSVASPSSQPSHSSDPSDTMADADVALRPRRLFNAQTPENAGLDLDASPILAASPSAGSRFSPRNVRNLVHHSPSRPSTPKGAATTPLNMRQHRPPHTSGPKPANFLEPSPSTQRVTEPRLASSRRREQDAATATPSRTRTHQIQVSANAETALNAPGHVTPLEEPGHAASSIVLQSLPKKKHRVSRTEIAVAHEEAGAGPIASPSPRKMTDYFSASQQPDDAMDSGSSRARSGSITHHLATVASLPSLTDLSAKASMNGLALAQSGLFLGLVARPLPGWTVYEDASAMLKSDDTAPSQDHPAGELELAAASSPLASAASHATPSTPNKENRRPEANLLASMVVPIALPDRAYSVDALPAKTRSSSRLSSAVSSPVGVAPRKRGTGGRLSLLADAEEGDATKDASLQTGDAVEEGVNSNVLGSGKKPRSRSTARSSAAAGSPTAIRKVSAHQRQASAGRRIESGLASRKGSSTYGVDPAASADAVASRTRSRTRV